MKKARNISRISFLILTVILLVYINNKSNDHTLSIVEFKYNTYKKLNTDSLDNKQKLDIILKDTTEFIDDSSRVKAGVNYLTLLFILLIVSEFFFLITTKKSPRPD
jgi:hypothetical protein